MDLDQKREPPTWARWAVLLGLALPHLVTGLWALAAPSGWFNSFPGIGPDLVAAEPPFNTHLATDAGAGFLATGIALLVVFFRAERDLMLLALITYLAFAAPHALYHSFNPAPGLSASEDVINVLSLWGGVVLALVVGAAVLRVGVSGPRQPETSQPATT